MLASLSRSYCLYSCREGRERWRSPCILRNLNKLTQGRQGLCATIRMTTDRPRSSVPHFWRVFISSRLFALAYFGSGNLTPLPSSAPIRYESLRPNHCLCPPP